MSIVFNNAQLPHIVRPERMGWLSGFGWGLGYCGGLIALFIVLAVDERALSGLDSMPYVLERLVGPASALWLAVFVIPMFLFTPDTASQKLTLLAGGAPGRLVAGRHGEEDAGASGTRCSISSPSCSTMTGWPSIIAFGGVYAAATFGWSTVTLGIFGIILTVFAIPGAFLGGKLDDRFGSKRTIQFATLGVIVATIGIVSVSADRVFFVVPASELLPTRGLFGSLQERVFMGFALLLGFCMGPMQAASRTMIGRIAPEGMSGEFFGLFALSGRATAWMGPLAIGIVTTATPIQPAGRGVRAGLPGARLRPALAGARGARQSLTEDAMITAIVNFKLPAEIDAKKATDLFKSSAPKYRAMKGLVRKYYLFDDQNRIGGGVYLWKSRADADAVYTPQWKAYIAERYGAPPDIRYFETSVVVDNESDKIASADAA